MTEMRQCNKCGELKPVTKFPTTVSAGNGRKYRRRECRQCGADRHLAWRENNRDKLRASGRLVTQRLRERRKAEIGVDAYRAEQAAWQVQYRDRLKEVIYSKYGGYKCKCCGETEPTFLSLDHINNDGHVMRKIHKTGTSFYRWVIKNNFPDSLQVLCMNCQHSKSRNGGICAHKQGVTTRA